MKIIVDLKGVIQIHIENEQDLKETVDKLNLIARQMGLEITIQDLNKPLKIRECELC